MEKNNKHWYDDWKTTRNMQGDGSFTVELPHSHTKEKKITIKGKYTRKHIEWLFEALDCALDTLTTRDKENIQIYGGDTGFKNLFYKGEKITAIEDTGTHVAYFNHMYRTAGYEPDAKKTHSCLFMGYWCWKNLADRPLDIVPYLRHKIAAVVGQHAATHK